VYFYVSAANWLFPYLDMKVNAYVDANGNREKFITQADFWRIGFAEVITYIDLNYGKAYENIPKIE